MFIQSQRTQEELEQVKASIAAEACAVQAQVTAEVQAVQGQVATETERLSQRQQAAKAERQRTFEIQQEIETALTVPNMRVHESFFFEIPG